MNKPTFFFTQLQIKLFIDVLYILIVLKAITIIQYQRIKIEKFKINIQMKTLSKQKQKNQEVRPSNNTSLSSTQDIATLLEYQDKLLNLIHTQLYAHPQIDEDTVVKFEVNHISQMNQAWKRMVEDLHFRLVKQKISYQSTLRDHFHKVLNVDYLPFLRINRYELTQVSLFGFDIYIQPLSTMLEIINRIEGQYHIASSRQRPEHVEYYDKVRDVWQSVRKNWNQFMYQSSLCKISLNIYILKQYLKVAAKSLVKKDKEIIFTGCTTMFNMFTPILVQNGQIWLLIQFSELNNELYQFHPSFNYSHFYSLLLPLRNEYEPIFRSIKLIAEKCLNANILTPLLFAILRNKIAFLDFIENIDHSIWASYLNGLVFGLIFNFKARILQYEQVMIILEAAVLKLGVLGQLQTACFAGQLGKQWSQARDFFISALKVGYNVGQLQTWHPTEFQLIQQRIIKFTKNSLLMHPSLPQKLNSQLFFSSGFEQQLEGILLELTGSLLNKNQFLNSFSPNICQAVSISGNAIYGLLKLAHLIKLCKLESNVNCMCYMLCFLNKVGELSSQVLRDRLFEIGDWYCQMAINQLEKQQKSRQDLKQTLFAYIKKIKPIKKLNQIIRICLMISTPKQAIPFILEISQCYQQQSGQKNKEDVYKIVAANIISSYCPERPTTMTKVKTFDRQYNIEQEIINVNSKLYLCLNVLVDAIMDKNSVDALQILLWMVRICNWLAIPLLNFPVSSRYDSSNQDRKLQSFSMWLISSPNHHPDLLDILQFGLTISSHNIKTYFAEICATTVCDQTLVEINRVLSQLCEIEDNSQYAYILKLILLFVKVCQGSKPILPANSIQLFRKVMRLYLRALQKLDTVMMNAQDENIAKYIAESIFEIYCPLLNMLHESPQKCRKWRTFMHKNCLISLDFAIEQIFHVRDFELPLIRKDKGFVVHNAVQQSKQKQSYIVVTTDRIKSRIDSLLNEASKYQSKNLFGTFRQIFEKPQYLISKKEINEFKMQPNQIGLYSKQSLIPSLSLKLIKSMLTTCNSPLLPEILSMSTSNHRKLTQLALLINSPTLLLQIGLSKQSVENLLPQILAVLTTQQQYSELVSSLDINSKKSISDNFNFMLMKQQLNCNDFHKIQEVIGKLSGGLGFLLVQNQSNWRYFNEVLSQLSQIKPYNLSNTSSVILQYMQYIRITYKPSQDYLQKLTLYKTTLQNYLTLLNQKLVYIESLQKPNACEQISKQQLHLYKINQLAYINSFCQGLNVYDFLTRAAQFRKQVGERVGDFGADFQVVEEVVRGLLAVNQIGNIFGGGKVLGPDFICSYSMCSEGAYSQGKLILGQCLQSYFRTLQLNISQIYTYLPTGNKIPITTYFNKYVSQISKVSPPTSDLIDAKIAANDKSVINLLMKNYSEIFDNLIGRKIICAEKNLQFVRNQETEQQNQSKDEQIINYLVFYFGACYRLMQITAQKVVGLGELAASVVSRQMLSWELMKSILPQVYHMVKAILVDDEIEQRKYTFSYNNTALVPQGQKIEVNKINKVKYCNLLCKWVIGDKILKRVTIFSQGFHSVVV